MRDATIKKQYFIALLSISIHASHAGCDLHLVNSVCFASHFNPRIPCGMRHTPVSLCSDFSYFNPRIPCGMRPTASVIFTSDAFRFQSTHPMRDATTPWCLIQLAEQFQSTHPMRDATGLGFFIFVTEKFQSTHPMRDATGRHPTNSTCRSISIHASHAGCDDLVRHEPPRSL